MELINHSGNNYPKFQAVGYAAQFAIPYALQFCKGVGVDIGCAKEEWKYPDSIPIDPVFTEFDSLNFPYENLDYIFSSHCLEHLCDWVTHLDYWTTKLKKEGILFLYLPAYSQTYWRPWNNRKHVNVLTPEIIVDYLSSRGYTNIFSSGEDLNNSFMIVAEKNF